MKSEELLAYWTIVLAIATIILAVATITIAVLAFYAFRQGGQLLRASQENSKRIERNSRFNVYRDIFSMLERTQKARVLINTLIRENNKAQFDFTEMGKNPQIITDVHKEIISDWDKIALMLEDQVVPEDFIMEYYSRGIITSWLYFSAFILHERAVRKHAGYKKKFEELHEKAYEFRKAKKHDGELVNLTDR